MTNPQTAYDRMLGVALQPGDLVVVVRGEREIVRAMIEPPYYPQSMMLYVDAARPVLPELTDGRADTRPTDATEPLGEPERAGVGGGLFGGGRAARHGR